MIIRTDGEIIQEGTNRFAVVIELLPKLFTFFCAHLCGAILVDDAIATNELKREKNRILDIIRNLS